MRRCLLFAFVRFVVGVAACAAAHAGIVISQVYGGGGNAGAAYMTDYVELFNAGPAAQDLMGWSVQYTSASGAMWQVTPLSGTMQPGQYLLVSEGTGGMNGSALPTPDVSGTINLSNSSGKVVLEASLVAETDPCPVAAIDFVGYGTANCYEGTGPAPGPPSGNADALWRSDPCVDTNDNSVDLVADPAGPRNSATTPAPCAPPEIGYAVLVSPTAEMTTPCQSSLASATVYGEVFIAGVTPSMSAPTGLVAQLGFGPAGSDPATSAGWTWTDAAFNPMHMGDSGDEYAQLLGVPHASGSYDYAYRFSYLGGAFVYADTGMGTADGYSPADAGKLAATGDTLYCDRFGE